MMQTTLSDYDYENMTLYELANSILKTLKHEDEQDFKRRRFFMTKIVRDQTRR